MSPNSLLLSFAALVRSTNVSSALVLVGDYNIEIPMVPQGLYKIMVSPFDDDSTYDCSGEFLIVSDIEYDMSYSYSWE